ncbi:MAG: hypothetical protein F6K47_41390, partial [Symploca sp. SIO2E6]|nr:hypothetical protein [Symploca sp. SIO2E6]
LYTGQCSMTLQGHISTVWSISFSPDGQTLASGSADRTVKVWDVYTGKCFMTLQGHISTVWSVSFSPDDQTLASGSGDQKVRIWEVDTGQCLNASQGYTALCAVMKYTIPEVPLIKGDLGGSTMYRIAEQTAV